MADTVNFHMERMLPELDDLEKRGLFTKSEIKKIVRKRREFEYLLKRHSTLKQDYLLYIDYEKKLESMRRLRKKGLTRDLQGSGKKWKYSLSDGASCNHIMHIYRRALTKFKGDLSLWLQYLEYCRSEAPTKMQKIATKCLQLHPTVPGLWMYLAAWEFEHNLNMNSARALMQRGLRMCPRAENLWIEYIRMELTYLQKLKARRLVLGLKPTESLVKDTSRRILSDLMRKDGEVVVEAGEKAEEEKAEEEFSSEDKISYKLAQTVYKNAIAAVPSNVDLRHRFVEALDTFEFEQKNELVQQIQIGIMADFPSNENSWDWLARRQVDSERSAIKIFEKALQAVPSIRMYELYAKYLTGLLDAETVALNSNLSSSATEDRTNWNSIAEGLFDLYQRSSASQIWSEALAKGQLELLLRSGRVDEAYHLGKELCNRIELQKSASLWEWRLKIAMDRVPSSVDQDVDSKTAVMGLFQDAITCVPFSESRQLWLIVMEFYRGQKGDFEVVVELLVKSLAGGSGGRIGADLAITFVNWVLRTQGIDQARQTYNRFLALPGPSLEFFKLCISIEAREATSKTDSFDTVRKLFNDAVDRFGHHDTDLWIDYYREEIKAGNVFVANNVYWRAKKALKDPSVFVERHQLLSQQF